MGEGVVFFEILNRDSEIVGIFFLFFIFVCLIWKDGEYIDYFD